MHIRSIRLIGLALAVGLFAAACGDDDESSSDTTAGAVTTAPASAPAPEGQGADVTIAVVTHGDGGSFWSVAKKGAEDAARDIGVTVDYQESNNDPQTQAQLIDAAVSAGVDGLVVSMPNPDAVRDSVTKAVDAGIPVITMNSGVDQFKEFGAITHVGQTETVAGQGAGEKFKELGATKLLCVIHEQANIGLEQRCEGLAEGFGGDVENLQVTGTADVSATLNEIQSKLTADSDIDGVLALNPDIALAAKDAIAGAGSSAQLATFDLSGDVVSSIKDGSIAFAIDQQQYLQGYLPVVFLYLYNTNANTVGGGLPVLTGPGIVDSTNADAVEALAEAGTR